MYILYGYGCYMISTLFSVSNLLCKTMDAQTQLERRQAVDAEATDQPWLGHCNGFVSPFGLV